MKIAAVMMLMLAVCAPAGAFAEVVGSKRLNVVHALNTGSDSSSSSGSGASGPVRRNLVSFDATGELATIVGQLNLIIGTTAAAIGSNNVTCDQICPSSGTCMTCEAARTATRRDVITLAADTYTIKLSGDTSKSPADVVTDLKSSITSLFTNFVRSGIQLTLDETSVAVTVSAVEDNGNDDDELSGGAIAGIVIGCVAFVVIVVVLVYCFCCKTGSDEDAMDEKHNKKTKGTSPDEV